MKGAVLDSLKEEVVGSDQRQCGGTLKIPWLDFVKIDISDDIEVNPS
ncbi:hypothetical protein HanIR_Chr15g0769501 [Helianthus annuus]|nr:hypothetical protein HanIR_Chr15g0769501 [Helianthus annuus]